MDSKQNNLRFTHRTALWSNRKNLLKGVLCLVGVDLLVFSLPYLVKLMIDRIQGRDIPNWLPRFYGHLSPFTFILCFCVLYLAVNALMAFVRYWWRVHLIWTTFPLFHQWRRNFFAHVMKLDRDFFKSKKVGDLISALTSDTENIRLTLSIGALMLIDALIYLVLFPCMLWQLNPDLTLVVVPPLFLVSVLALTFSNRLSDQYEKVQDLTADLSGRAYEISSGVRVIKAFRREKIIHEQFSFESKRLRDAALRVATYQGVFGPGLDFALALALVGVLVFGGMKVLDGSLSLSNLVAFQLYLANMDWPMMAIGWFIQMYRSSQASQKRLQNFAAIQSPLVVDSTLPVRASRSLFEWENVSFSFQSKRKFKLEKISFKISEGGFIGLTGSVGSGKTTFLELCSRQRDPLEGQIFYRGRNLKSFSPSEIAERILYVPQESFMFSRSIRSNLAFGLKDFPEDDKLWTLLHELCFEEENLKMRGGLSSLLGERGTNLSGGQRQRLSLGRALCRSRDIYLLDDIFSHIDAETEARIFKFLRTHLEPRTTVFLVSQRFETLRQCREVLVLDKGRLEFQGSPDEARNRNDFFMELERLQGLESEAMGTA